MPAVHPRERGEHLEVRMRARIVGGSSPRARGTQVNAGGRANPARFIPASAGNTSDSLITLDPMSVHPRERGEHAEVVDQDHVEGGSSPRARGTLLAADQAYRASRFIPASAGNTASRWPRQPR